ncbi:hypothetical protein [Bacillus sp. FJAT-47783]|uniref:hypothetical protein n=1 Tax=Bacillus sp. FJAT-47783 TaxID=2922712 RepID=UPI001FABD861|nr:hypothetical protein [Bacillus sp. FJAT-47783]
MGEFIRDIFLAAWVNFFRLTLRFPATFDGLLAFVTPFTFETAFSPLAALTPDMKLGKTTFLSKRDV